MIDMLTYLLDMITFLFPWPVVSFVSYPLNVDPFFYNSTFEPELEFCRVSIVTQGWIPLVFLFPIYMMVTYYYGRVPFGLEILSKGFLLLQNSLGFAILALSTWCQGKTA